MNVNVEGNTYTSLTVCEMIETTNMNSDQNKMNLWSRKRIVSFFSLFTLNSISNFAQRQIDSVVYIGFNETQWTDLESWVGPGIRRGHEFVLKY